MCVEARVLEGVLTRGRTELSAKAPVQQPATNWHVYLSFLISLSMYFLVVVEKCCPHGADGTIKLTPP